MSNPHVIVGTLELYYTAYTSWRVLLFSKGGIETCGFYWPLCRGPFDWGRYVGGPFDWGRYVGGPFVWGRYVWGPFVGAVLTGPI